MTPAAWSSATEWTTNVRSTADVAVAQVRARRLAEHVGLPRRAQVEFAIVVSEAASNMLVHAGSGRLTLRGVPGRYVELVARDRGPGIADVTLASRDGVSRGLPTAQAPFPRSLGSGLGAMARLSDSLHIDSSPQGTCVRAVKAVR